MTTPPDALAVATRPLPTRPPRWGWRVVAAKEFGDGILSVRLFILILALLACRAIFAIYSTAAFVGNNAQAATASRACSW